MPGLSVGAGTGAPEAIVTAPKIVTDATGVRWVDTDTPERQTRWNARDLLGATFDEPRYAVEGMFPEGLSFVAGAPKLGKSWMALGLAVAVASGGRALGAVPVERGEALYLALEDSPRRLQTRLRMVLDGAEAPSGLELVTEWPRLDDGGVEALDAWLDEHLDPRLVLIDVWPRIRPRTDKRTDHYQADYDGAAALQNLAIRRGVAVVALFHTRKAEAGDFVETVQGTFGTAAAADTIVVVKRARGQADATLFVTGRDVEERELALRFAPEAGTWALLGDASEYALGETRHQLLEAVRAHGSLTPKEAAEVTGIDHAHVKVALWRMAKDGQLAAEKGRYSSEDTVTPVTALPVEGQGGDRVTAVTPPQGDDRGPLDGQPSVLSDRARDVVRRELEHRGGDAPRSWLQRVVERETGEEYGFDAITAAVEDLR